MVPAGGSVHFIGRGFARRQLVTAELHSRTIILGRFRANDVGRVSGTVTIPRRVHLGWHTFRLTARHPFRSVSARIRVVRHEHRRHDRHHRWHDGRGRHHYDRLAATGSERTLAVGGAAAGLIAVGGGTMLAVRRRRNA
ncbi:LPXTG cell wall anchor domain-containing protein [Streptomyces nodosus]